MNGHANGQLNGRALVATHPPEPERSTRQLLDEFEQSGSQEPFEEIVRRYGGMVFSVCFQVTRSAHDAEDATQAVFLSLAVQLRTGKQINFLGPWLQQVARRMSMDIRRSKKRRKHREDVHGVLQAERMIVEDSSMPLQDDERALVVREEVDSLPAKYRMPLILHYFGGLSREEMAKELKCRTNTLGVRLHRGRQMLAEKLQKRGMAFGAVTGAPVILDGLLHDVARQSVLASMGGNLHATSQVASQIIAGHSVLTNTVVSARVMKLAREVTTMMLLARVKFAAASVIVSLGLLTAGATTMANVLPLDFSRTFTLPTLDVFGLVRRMIAPITQSLPSLVDAQEQKKPDATASQFATATYVPAQDVQLDPAVETNAWLGLKRSFEYTPVTLARTAQPFANVQPPGARSTGSPARDGVAIRSTGASRSESAARTIEFIPPAPLARFDTPRATNVAASARSNGPASTDAPNRQPPVPESNIVLLSSIDGGVSGVTGGLVGSGAGYALPSGLVVTGGSFVTNSVADHALTSSWNFSAADGATLAHSNLHVRQLAHGESVNTARTYVATGGTYAYDAGRWNSNAPAVVRGYGRIVTPNTFDNNGVVIAEHGTLRIDAPAVGNPIDNPVGGTNGWYAKDGGTLELPTTYTVSQTSAGMNVAATWGESADDKTLDMVNSVRATFHHVTSAGRVDISLLSSDSAEVPNRPKGTESISIHKFENEGIEFASADLVIRYDAVAASTDGLSEAGLKVWSLCGGQWHTVDRTIDLQNKLVSAAHLASLSDYYAIGGNPARLGLSAAEYAYVVPTIVITTTPAATTTLSFSSAMPAPVANSSSVPEPASAALLALGAGFLLRRRRRGI